MLQVYFGTSSDVHKSDGLEILKAYAFLHINAAHFLNLIALGLNFLAIVNFEFVYQIAGVNLKLLILIRDYENVGRVLSNLPKTQR